MIAIFLNFFRALSRDFYALFEITFPDFFFETDKSFSDFWRVMRIEDFYCFQARQDFWAFLGRQACLNV